MKSNRVKRWGIALAISGFVLGAPACWLLISPSRYLATARVEIDPNPDLRCYDLHSLQNKFDVLLSSTVLRNVVADLRLDAEWGKRYAAGRKLDMTEAVARLKRSIRLTPVPKTTFIDIHIISEDSLESEYIANAVTDAFCDKNTWRSSATDFVKVLEQEHETAEQNVKSAQAESDRLKVDFNPRAAPPEKLGSKWQSYCEAEQRLERAKHFLKVADIKLFSTWLPPSPVRKVRQARIETTPIFPNTLGLVLLHVSAMLVFCGAFLAARNWHTTSSYS